LQRAYAQVSQKTTAYKALVLPINGISCTSGSKPVGRSSTRIYIPFPFGFRTRCKGWSLSCFLLLPLLLPTGKVIIEDSWLRIPQKKEGALLLPLFLRAHFRPAHHKPCKTIFGNAGLLISIAA
jgi:hypothetical protein